MMRYIFYFNFTLSHSIHFNPQISPHSLSSFHPRFSLRIPGDGIQTLAHGFSDMRLQISHVLSSIDELNALLPTVSPDSTPSSNLICSIFNSRIDSLVQIEYPVCPAMLDSDEWLLVFDGPPVFNPIPGHGSFVRAGTTALSSLQGLWFLYVRVS